jgi:hypothetical protein
VGKRLYQRRADMSDVSTADMRVWNKLTELQPNATWYVHGAIKNRSRFFGVFSAIAGNSDKRCSYLSICILMQKKLVFQNDRVI